MTKILSLLQIKSVRSAWFFLIGSGLLFVFGAYQITTALESQFGEHPGNFEIIFFSFWFAITAGYMAIAAWALFSQKGREYLEAQEKIPIDGHRGVLWYLKFIFACWAAAFATIVFLGVLVLPFSGYDGFEVLLSPNRGMYVLISGLVWSPLIFGYLK